MNRLTIIGNLTNDPELRTTPSGDSVCSFGVALLTGLSSTVTVHGDPPLKALAAVEDTVKK